MPYFNSEYSSSSSSDSTGVGKFNLFKTAVRRSAVALTTLGFFAVTSSTLTSVYAAASNLIPEDVSSESQARELLSGMMATVKKISSSDIETIVKKGYWELASEIVHASHEQGSDLSFAVRKGVKEVKNRADELIRTLNPKYNEKQQVIPVFRWAQNDTSIFLTIKYSVKWDAPGAVNVKDPTVTIKDNLFQFRAYGEHSGNKYEYKLDLDCFDHIMESESSWSEASVGRFTAVIAKKRSSKWPRLLLDKKKKGTGRVDLTRQEELERNNGMGGVSLVAQSERTCAASKKIYCPSKDNCVTDCGNCTERTNNKGTFCSGAPKKGVSTITFTDTDMRLGLIGGVLTMEQQRAEYDLKEYLVKFGKTSKVEANRTYENFIDVAKVPTDLRSKDIFYELSDIQKLELSDDEDMFFAVFTVNEFGSVGPVWSRVEDGYLPSTGPTSAAFHDVDGEPNKISGDIVIKSEDDPTIEEFAMYWGKKSGRKLTTDALIGTTKPNVSYKLDSRSIPNGATHILVHSKNKYGENSNSITMAPIIDNSKPCAGKSKKDSEFCPSAIKSIGTDQNSHRNWITLALVMEKEKKKFPKDVSYTVYAATGEKCDGESNYKELMPVKPEPLNDGTVALQLADVQLNAEAESWRYTHLQVYTMNTYGKSKYCSSIAFEDLPPKTDDL